MCACVCGWEEEEEGEDDAGVTHDILQGEGGEQGDPFMPIPGAAPRGHSASEAIHNTFRPTETLMACLDYHAGKNDYLPFFFFEGLITEFGNKLPDRFFPWGPIF